MEEILNQKLKEWASRETIYQIIIAALVVLGIVAWMAKHFKSIHEAWPSILKVLKWIKEKLMHRTLFRQEVRAAMTKLNFALQAIEERMARVEYEVRDNSGGSMKDGTKRIETKLDDALIRLDFNELKLDAGFQLGNRMYAVFDKDTEMIDVNPVFLKFFGWTKEEMLRGGHDNIIHEDDRNGFENRFTKSIDSGSKFADPEVRIFDSGGKVHKVCVTGHPQLSWPSGEVIKYFVTFEIVKHE